MLSARIRKLLGKRMCPFAMIRTIGGRKAPSSWKKKRSGLGQLGGGGGMDKIGSEGRARL